jgi:ankyrin repeat protein
LNLLFKYDAKISKCPPVNGQEIYYWVVYCVIFTNEVIEILLKNGLDPNRLLDRGETALEGSCSLMTHEVMVLFLKHGADPNLINEETKKTVLYKPSKAGNAALVGILLKYGADPNKACEDQDKMTPLYIASQRGHYDVVKVLLEKGADPNKVIAGDFTPLDVAVSQLRHEVINLLIKYGARRSKPVNVIIDNVPISPTGLTDSEEDVAEEEESSSD